MIALIIDKVIYEDKYSIKFLEMQFFVFFFLFFVKTSEISLNLVNKRK